MNKNYKIRVIFLLILVSVFVHSIREQIGVLAIGCIVFLVVASLYKESKIATSSLCIGFIILYPSPQMGWLYGRDSINAALNSVRILQLGWPIPNSTLGFIQTPLIHFHAATVSRITGIGIFPTINPEILVTSILPIVYSGVVIFVSFLIVRRSRLYTISKMSATISIFPILFWIPFFQFHTAFVRESLGMVFFVYIIYTYMNDQIYDDRFKILIFIFSLSIIPTHHFSSFMILIYMAGALLLHKFKYNDYSIHLQLLVLFSVAFLTWYIILGFGGSLLLKPLYMTEITQLNDIISFISESPNDKVAGLSNTVSRPLFIIYKIFIALWIYQMLLAIGIISGYISWFRHSKMEFSTIFEYSIIYGIAVALFSFSAWITGIITFHRIMSFFVVGFAWIAPIGFYYALVRIDIISPTKLVKLFIICLVVIGMTSIPAHILFDNSPNYEKGQLSQRFQKDMYVMRHFVGNYINVKTNIVGGTNTLTVAGSIPGYRRSSKPTAISRGHVPENSVVILQDREKYLYSGQSPKYGKFSIDPKNLFVKYNTNEHRVYDSGNLTIFSGDSVA